MISRRSVYSGTRRSTNGWRIGSSVTEKFSQLHFPCTTSYDLGQRSLREGHPMNSRLKPAPLGTFDSETVEQPAAKAVERPKVCCPNRQIVNASGPHLTNYTHSLLPFRP